MLARRDAAGVRLLTRNGIDWAGRCPGIMSAVNGLRCRSCLIDGEVVICGEDGIPIFNRLRQGRQVKGDALLFAFDLIELDGRDLRREPIEARKATLAQLLRKAANQPPAQRAHHRTRRRGLQARLLDGPRRHCLILG
jgi:bifunctional non-homologous end joining protein LigD